MCFVVERNFGCSIFKKIIDTDKIRNDMKFIILMSQFVRFEF